MNLAAASNAAFERNAFILLQGLPRGSYIIMDQQAYRTDTQFEGFKLVPPGLHVIAWQSANDEVNGDTHNVLAAHGVRTIWLLYTYEKTVVVRNYDAASDAWTTAPGTEAGTQVVVSLNHLKSMDKHLAPYPFGDYKKWQTLTHYLNLSHTTLARVFHVDLEKEDATCDSFTSTTERDARTSVHELRSAYRQDSPVSHGIPGLAFTPFSLSHSWPPDAHGEERTRWSIDKSWLFQRVMTEACKADRAPLTYEPLLREFELCFILFQCTNNAAALDHWAALITLFSRATAHIGSPFMPHSLHPCEWGQARIEGAEMPDFAAHIAWMHTLAAQWKALPKQIWENELAYLEVSVLNDMACLRASIARSLGAWATTHPGAAASTKHERLVHAWRKLSTAANEQFGWTLDAQLDEEAEADGDLEEGEDAPVIVDTQSL